VKTGIGLPKFWPPGDQESPNREQRVRTGRGTGLGRRPDRENVDILTFFDFSATFSDVFGELFFDVRDVFPGSYDALRASIRIFDPF
jgi:hypothetical protein